MCCKNMYMNLQKFFETESFLLLSLSLCNYKHLSWLHIRHLINCISGMCSEEFDFLEISLGFVPDSLACSLFCF